MFVAAMALRIDTLDTGDVAYFLRGALGRLRANWTAFLGDCIRDKTDLFGLQLLPIARVKIPGDKSRRPRYTAQAVKEFIVGVLKHVSRPSESEREMQKVTIEIDPEMLALPMSARRAKVAKSPRLPPAPTSHYTRS